MFVPLQVAIKEYSQIFVIFNSSYIFILDLYIYSSWNTISIVAIRHTVFPPFKDNLFTVNHLWITSKNLFIFSSAVLQFSPVAIIAVSSAYDNIYSMGIAFKISLIYSIKSSGPRIVP